MTDTDHQTPEDQEWASQQMRTLLEARHRIEGRDRLDQAAAVDLAAHQLRTLYGNPDGDMATAFNHGVVGYFADHVSYMPGYALFGPMRTGLAVAVAPGSESVSRTSIWPEGSTETFSLGSTDRSRTGSGWWANLIKAVSKQITGLPKTIDVSIVSAIPTSNEKVFLATLGVTLAEALYKLSEREQSLSDAKIADAVSFAAGYHHSPAFVTAVRSKADNAFTLVDSANCEFAHFDAVDEPVVGYIEVESQPRLEASFVSRRRVEVQDCLAEVRAGFPELPSLAHLQHQDLQEAERLVSRRFRPLLNYLVKENQRVQRAVTASRKGDWQFFGGLLFISNASLQADWGLDAPGAEFISNLVQGKTTDGLTGARIIGNGRGVYIAGLPFSVPEQLDDIKKSYKEKFGTVPRTELL